MQRNRSLALSFLLTLVFLAISTPPVGRRLVSAQGQSTQEPGSFQSEVFQRVSPKFIWEHSFANPEFRKAQEANPARGRSAIDDAEAAKEVRMIYLVPRDRAPKENYQAAIANAILSLQKFYQTQMGSNSTFSLHEPIVEVYTTSRTSAYYASLHSFSTQFFQEVLRDGFALSGGGFFDPSYRWVYYIDADNDCGQVIGGNEGVALLGINDLKGLAGEPDLICGADAFPHSPCRWVGGLGHELGHTWNLPHPPGCDQGSCSGGSLASSSLMWLGFYDYPSTYLLDDNKSQLSATGFFNSMASLGVPSDCNVRPVVKFSTANLSFVENTATAAITVTRTGDTSTIASVDYATMDGSAGERTDYLTAVGKLRFAPGESSKTINVFLVNDTLGESAETFTVNLSNPVSCTLDSPASLTITINSDESVNGQNPVNDASLNTDFFVRQHYLDFFNREADAPGLAFWKNQIDECLSPACRDIRKINVSAAFFVSSEFQQTGYLVYKANQVAFNSGEFLKLRDFLPDLQEIGRGVVIGQPGADAQLEANKQKFFMDFVQRANFLDAAAYPSYLSAAQFVDKLNSHTLDPNNVGAGPSLSASERNALVTQLSARPASAELRAQVLRSIVENSLFHVRQFNKAFVLMQYFGYLRRNPNDPPETGLDFTGYNFWLSKLNQFNSNFVDAEMVKAFILSSEYQQRFGP